MNLLDATTTLIDAVKTYAPEDDLTISRAVKRMEKRLFVLQVRSAKSRRRNRRNAFWDAMGQFGGGVCASKNVAIFPCKKCDFVFDFGSFCKNSEFTGSGKVVSVSCPQCGLRMDRSK